MTAPHAWQAGSPAVVSWPGRQPLVLVSGMLGDASLWDGVCARLGDIALPCPARIDLDDSVPAMAESVLAQAPDRFALAGHSLGAIVALEMLRQAPGRITRVALVNASARGPVDVQRTAWARARAAVSAGRFDDVVAQLAVATLAAAHRDRANLVAAGVRMAATVRETGFLRQLAAQESRPDSLDDLGRIAVPVLVVSGALDEICPPALQRELAAGCQTAELVSVENAGHMVPLEAPAELAGALRAWLSRRAPEAPDRELPPGQ